MNNYPTLRLGVLQGMSDQKALVDADPEHLQKPEGPYDLAAVELLENDMCDEFLKRLEPFRQGYLFIRRP
ncbi:hypothetical protein OKA06_01380 [Novosphingobium sp. MW5]|nr:hypothetical protein [Novosphingobium sp. MW5]